MNKKNYHAIILGRFQPFHNGHLATIKKISESISKKIIIGVVIDMRALHNSKNGEFELMIDKKIDSKLNPFSFWERYIMIKNTLSDKIDESEINVLPLPRPDVWWNTIKSLLPIDRQWIISKHDKFDDLKAQFLIHQKESVIRIDEPSKIHGTEIRQLISNGRPWKHLIPKPVLKILIEIDGENRLKS